YNIRIGGFTMIKSLLTEYGIPWVFNRSLYSMKLKMLRTIPLTEKVYEKPVNIKRIDIFDINKIGIQEFLNHFSHDKKKEIIAIADKAIEGKIIAFSSLKYDYGNPIDWHYNPKTKMRLDKKLKWYEIPDFDPETGDIKS